MTIIITTITPILKIVILILISILKKHVIGRENMLFQIMS